MLTRLSAKRCFVDGRVGRCLAPVQPLQALVDRRDSHGTDGLLHSRGLHTSQALHARVSFTRRVQEKIRKYREDPKAQQKLVGVSAAGYSLAKVAKAGAVAKYALPALKLTKAMPLMSMGLTTVCYACLFGLPFAVGIVGILASSNASRALLLRRFGCEVPPQMMIPFFGTMSSNPGGDDFRKSEAFVLADDPFRRCLVILAPVAGMWLFTAAVPFGAAGLAWSSQCGYAVANTGFMMGMFSLLPMGDMTPGGQLLNYFSKNALLLGTVFNLALICVLPNPILYLCFFLNLWRLYQRGFTLFGRQFGGSDEAAFDATLSGLTRQIFSDNQKVAVAAMYWLLFLLNAGGMVLVGRSLASPQQLRRELPAARPAAQPAEFSSQPGRFSPPPPSDGGWSIGDWAMGNLETLEEMDRGSGDSSMDWWEQAQLDARRNVPANERFMSDR